MPALVTHCIYAQKMINNSDTSYLHQVINRHPNVYNLGAQGPDLFLFYHKVPVIESHGEEINKLGSYLHVNKINELFASIVSSAKQFKDEIMIAYVAGFLTHHALDSQTHPFIIYSTGSPIHMNKFAHVMFENQIDIGVLQEHKLTIKDIVPYKLIKTTQKEKKTIIQLLTKMFDEAFNMDIAPKVISDCLRDAYLVEKILYDKTGRKVALLEKIEKVLNCPGLATSMVIPPKYDDILDAMNYRQDEWCNPTDKNAKTNASFLQLAQKAVELGVKELKIFENFLLEKQDLNALLDVIGSRSYETNVDVSLKQAYFK